VAQLSQLVQRKNLLDSMFSAHSGKMIGYGRAGNRDELILGDIKMFCVTWWGVLGSYIYEWQKGHDGLFLSSWKGWQCGPFWLTDAPCIGTHTTIVMDLPNLNVVTHILNTLVFFGEISQD